MRSTTCSDGTRARGRARDRGLRGRRRPRPQKRPLMGRVARELADVVIVTSDNPRSEDPLAIIQDVLRARAPTSRSTLTGRSAIERAIDLAESGRRRRDRGQGARAGPGDRGREARVRRPGRGPRGPARMIPISVRALETLGLGELDSVSDEITGLQIDSRLVRPGDLFVAIRGGLAFVDEARDRGAATLVPTTSSRRWRFSARCFAPAAALGSSASPARPVRRPRRTSSLRSVRRSRARSRPRAATTPSSACRSRSAGSSRRPRSASWRWACAAWARSPTSARSPVRTSA